MSDVAATIEGLDAALRGIRAFFHSTGAHEVLTPVVCPEVAIEPFIEPEAQGRGYVRTSPELQMKRLLAHGAGDIFQVAPVGRKDEVGRWHRPQFHLVEWYRHGDDIRRLHRDIEALVQVVGQGAAVSFATVSMVERMGEDLGIELRGDEPGEALEGSLAQLRARAGVASQPVQGSSAEARQLSAWTELHSLWADLVFEPWLRGEGPAGVHLCEFPAPLAALSRVDGTRASRFETYVGGIELANGYFELADADEQRRRFEVVNGLRRGLGQKPLPMPERFLAALRSPGLPVCCGAALGLERLIALSKSQSSLDSVLPESNP